MNTPRSPRTMSIRRWLSLGLLALFLAPVLTMGVIGFFVFRDTHGPTSIADVAEKQLIDGAERWEDPAWQAAMRSDLAGDHVDVVLLVAGKEIYRTRQDPVGTGGMRLVRAIDVHGRQPAQRAYIYSDEQIGPPRELREWFVPVALISALVLTLASIAWFLRRSIVLPLTATSNAAGRIAAGELDISLPPSRVREVAELEQAFESMSAALRGSLEAQATMEQDRRLFISAIAHDLRTPLFSLRGSLEGLETGIANTPGKQARYIALAQAKAAALERLISDLFAYSRTEYMEEEPVRSPIDLSALLAQIVEGVQPQADAAGIALMTDPGPPSVTLRGDSHLLTRVFENLLDNALRHTPKGGTVRVAWRESGQDVNISVADTGPGIAAFDLPHLFEPLYRGESSRNRQMGGAGLGLTIARRIVEAHKGTLEAANSPSGGAVFTATLPKAE